MAAKPSAELRRALVERLDRRGLIASPEIRRAFLSVPRELFVPDFAARAGLEAVYRDEAILTKQDTRGAATSSSSQPAIMALMLERLEPEAGARVLEIGAGTGYNAALLAAIGASVISVELDPDTAADARAALAATGYDAEIVTGDGRQGWPPGAPYDRMIVTASAAEIPRAWHDQLVEGGLLVVPLQLGASGVQAIPALRREPDGFRSASVLCGGFMPLRARPDEEVAPPTGIDLPQGRGLAHLAGPELEGERRQHLLEVTREPPRVRRLVLRAPMWSLALYLAFEAPAGRFVHGPLGAGVIGADGGSLALASGSRLLAWGGDEAERLLERLLAQWRERGRPDENRLELTVRFEDGRSRIAHRWL